MKLHAELIISYYILLSINYVVKSICVISDCSLVVLLVSDHLLLRDFGPYGIV
jgi:hypothetical protein